MLAICISYNTGKSALRARGRVCIYQAKYECLICYTSGTLKICPNLKLISQLTYIITDADRDCGRYFNVFIMFPNVSMSIQ